MMRGKNSFRFFKMDKVLVATGIVVTETKLQNISSLFYKDPLKKRGTEFNIELCTSLELKALWKAKQMILCIIIDFCCQIRSSIFCIYLNNNRHWLSIFVVFDD